MSLVEENPQPTEAAIAADASFRNAGVLTVAAGHAAHDTYSGFLPVLLPSLVERFALSNTQAGWLSTFTQIPSILQPVFGHLADRLALRWIVILAPAVTATLMSLAGWAPTYVVLALLLATVGVSSAAFHAVGSATAGRLSVQHLGRGLSLWMVGGELGAALGPIIVAGALALHTIKGLAWLMVLGWAASFLLYRQLSRAHLHPVAAADRPRLRHSLGRMRRVMLLMGALVVLRAMATTAPWVFAPLFLKEEGSGGFVAGAAVALFLAAGMAGTLGAGWISDRVGRRAVLLFGVLAGPTGLLLFTLLHGWARFPFLALAGAALVSLHPMCMALVQEAFPESRGLANAIYLSTAFVISSGAAVVVGALGDSMGLRGAFVVSALVAFLSVPLILVLPGKRKVEVRA
ncbi:MAG: MFS transporter [Actinomycetota bacterium]